MHVKYQKLVALIKDFDSALVAFSGGVDSSLLLAAAVDALGERVLAVTVASVLHTDRELKRAVSIAEELKARHVVLEVDEMSDPDFAKNPLDRCYICKSKRMIELRAQADQLGLSEILEGSNIDDLRDYRPGMKAIEEQKIRSPFVQLGFGKDLIRELAKEKMLPVWDEPSNACLASRIAYGEHITLKRLLRIEKAEEYLRKQGFRGHRVRDHGELARVEVGLMDQKRFAEEKLRKSVVLKLQTLGFKYVCLDLQGYRTGSMNVTETK